jgi:hypothetical protein
VGVEACGMGSTVTAKRMCSMAFESCCLGCGFFDTLLLVWYLASSSCSGLVVLVSSVFVAMSDIFQVIVAQRNLAGSNIRSGGEIS